MIQEIFGDFGSTWTVGDVVYEIGGGTDPDAVQASKL
jgi:hypothetical protein